MRLVTHVIELRAHVHVLTHACICTFFKCSGSITGGVGESRGCGLAGTLVIRFNLIGVPAEK